MSARDAAAGAREASTSTGDVVAASLGEGVEVLFDRRNNGGWSPSTARVVFSTGLVEVLEPRELEAVIGHELGDARYWDIAVMPLAEVPAIALQGPTASCARRTESCVEVGTVTFGGSVCRWLRSQAWWRS